MKKKIIIVLTVMFSAQFIASCCDERTFSGTIIGVSTILFEENDIGFREITSLDPIDKSDFALNIIINDVQTQISSVMNELSAFGFSAAYATSCPDNIIVYTNFVERIEILVTEVGTSNAVDITQDFIVINRDNMSIAEFVSSKNPADNNFVVQLEDTSRVPMEAVFTINIHLNDNTILGMMTNQVNFN